MDTKRFVDEAIAEVAREAIREVINHHAGFAIEDGIRQSICDRAAEIVREPEFEALIREQLTRWIKHA